MGRRNRARERLSAPTADYADDAGNVLTLRGALSPASRREYEAARMGRLGGAAARDDDLGRALEFLFERLAVRWTIEGLPIERQRELLGRLRMASPAERAWVRDTLRAHCAERFPEVEGP